ncbi:hypothetical protein SADUNF_Sadunf07G0022000 [Salix dunnii]|uniref:Maf-like protein n=1 Tax=Salix dunnii TaxID=1413687 RepID=A0A835K4A4_9ROSI|nr:hypothetical protein SADUNF_Sadunf07G0022000 [Salix dunnii]
MELEKEIEGKMTTCNSSFKIILGSSSLARRQILNEMGYEFTVVTADIDEKSIRKDKPEELVMALAEAKANAIIERLRIEGHVEEDARATLLITADTVVVSNGMVREKPNNKEEAREFIKGYSGGHAAVIGSVVVSNLTTGIQNGAWEKAEVYFHEIPDEIIDSVIEEGSTLHVAGGLTLEHPLTSPFVEAVVSSPEPPLFLFDTRVLLFILQPSSSCQVGSTDTVWGLSKALTEKLIKDNLVAPIEPRVIAEPEIITLLFTKVNFTEVTNDEPLLLMAYTEIEETERQDQELCSSEGSAIFEDDMMEIFFMALDKDLCSEDQELCSEGPTILEDDMTEMICSEDDDHKVEKFFMALDKELCSEDDQGSYCEEPNKIILKSFDEEPFFVDEAVIVESQTIKHMLEDDCANNKISLLNVTFKEYLTNVTEKDEYLKSGDTESVKAAQIQIFEDTLAAKYLHISRDQLFLFRAIKSLLDLTCQAVADMIKWKTEEPKIAAAKGLLDLTCETDESLVNNSSEPGHEEDNGFFENPENHDDFHDAADNHDENHQGDLELNHDDNHQEELEHQVTEISMPADFVSHGVGYKARAEAEGRLLFLKLGYSHEVELTVPPAVRVFCFKNNVVCCTGIDKGRVHQFAASVRSCKPPEVYKGKGIMYIDEVIKKKQGKKSK